MQLPRCLSPTMDASEPVDGAQVLLMGLWRALRRGWLMQCCPARRPGQTERVQHQVGAAREHGLLSAALQRREALENDEKVCKYTESIMHARQPFGIHLPANLCDSQGIVPADWPEMYRMATKQQGDLLHTSADSPSKHASCRYLSGET